MKRPSPFVSNAFVGVAGPATLLLAYGLGLGVLTRTPQNVDWPVYGGGPEGLRYSRLNQINRTNVRDLKMAWSFAAGDAFVHSQIECNPLVIDGVLYATTAKVNVIALDAATGAVRWRFDPHEGRKVYGAMRNRGVTYWADGSDKRIFIAVRQYLFALNATTGKPVLSFGDRGHIDLRDHLRIGDRQGITLSTPGIIYKDLLIVGSLTSETLPSLPGDIRAFDVRTGALRWTFHTIPHPGEFGYDTWPPDAWQRTGSANNWTGMALDESRGLVFVPTGSAAYDFYGADRAGDNLFANSLIALNAATGERVWHFQIVRHDIWDRDLPSPPNLVTVVRDGRAIDAVAQTTKSGHVYLFERTTGRPLFPIEYRRAPASDLEGEQTAATQPFPVRPEPFARQRLTAGMLTDRTPEAHAAALEQFSLLRSDGQFVPGSREGTIIFPGFDGGAEWGGAAFDPETSLLYVNSNEMAWILTMFKVPPAPTTRTSGQAIYSAQCATCHRADFKGTPPEFPSLEGLEDNYADWEFGAVLREGAGRMPAFATLSDDASNALYRYITRGEDTATVSTESSVPDMKYQSTGYVKFLDADGYPAIKPPWGTLNAINLATGAHAWKIPLGEYPALARQGLTNTGTENYGGPIVTAGGLVFIGATNYDRTFRAFDKSDGRLLWEAILPAGGNATPSTYMVNGRQFVVIAAGGGRSADPPAASFVAFALPE